MTGGQNASVWWVPLLSFALALVFCAGLIAVNGFSPLVVYRTMFEAAFGSFQGWSETLVKAIPLLLAGLGLMLAYRISIWNIGAEGQLIAGAVAATGLALFGPDLPGNLMIPAMAVAGFAAGSVWALLVAIPRAYLQVNELITSLMLNYVALFFMEYLVYGPWKDPEGFNFPLTAEFALSEQLATLGDTRLHLGLLFGLAAAAVFAFLLKRSRWGYELRMLGANPSTAQYGGIPIERHIIVVMLLSGGLAGLAGMAEVSGVTHRLQPGFSPGYGYTAIIVAWLGRLNPWGVVFSSVLFGGLLVGGYSVQTIGLPSAVSTMIEGAILFFVIGGEMLSRYRWSGGWWGRTTETTGSEMPASASGD